MKRGFKRESRVDGADPRIAFRPGESAGACYVSGWTVYDEAFRARDVAGRGAGANRVSRIREAERMTGRVRGTGAGSVR